jgi:UDP-glucose 4-epimerase
MSKTIIITGATGYIGGHTALAFKLAGYTVIGIDRKITIPASVEFLDEFLCLDYADIVDYCAPIREADAIIHCAGTSLVAPSLTDPGEYYSNNVAKTNKMLGWLFRKGWIGNIVFSSSASVYGNTDNIPISESSLYQRLPVSPYGWSKLMTERIIADHCQAHGFKAVSLRYFNAAGCDPETRMGCDKDGTHLVTKVVNSVLSNQIITINGNDYNTRDGTCIRDYVHVMDIAQAHIEAVCLTHGFDSGHHRAYNIGSGVGFTNQEILDQTQDLAGYKLNWQYGPRRQGDPDELVADPRRFIQDTKWQPTMSNISDILSTTWNWMKKTYYNN